MSGEGTALGCVWASATATHSPPLLHTGGSSPLPLAAGRLSGSDGFGVVRTSDDAAAARATSPSSRASCVCHFDDSINFGQPAFLVNRNDRTNCTQAQSNRIDPRGARAASIRPPTQIDALRLVALSHYSTVFSAHDARVTEASSLQRHGQNRHTHAHHKT